MPAACRRNWGAVWCVASRYGKRNGGNQALDISFTSFLDFLCFYDFIGVVMAKYFFPFSYTNTVVAYSWFLYFSKVGGVMWSSNSTCMSVWTTQYTPIKCQFASPTVAMLSCWPHEILLTHRHKQTYKHLPKYSQLATILAGVCMFVYAAESAKCGGHTTRRVSRTTFFCLLTHRHIETDTVKTIPVFAITGGNISFLC